MKKHPYRPTAKQQKYTIKSPATRFCPHCHYHRATRAGVFLPHPDRNTLRVDADGNTISQPCPMSGKVAPTVEIIE